MPRAQDPPVLCYPGSTAGCKETVLGRGPELVLKQHREQNPPEQSAASWGGPTASPAAPTSGAGGSCEPAGRHWNGKGRERKAGNHGRKLPCCSTGAGLGLRCSPGAQLLVDWEPKPSAHTWGSGAAGRAGTKELFAAAVNGSLVSDLFCLGVGIVLGQEVPVTLWSAVRFQAEVQEAAMALFS